MEIIETRSDMIAAMQRGKGRIGFAATMGALHDGHVAVIRAASAQSDRLVASLFVNPAQFQDSDRFVNYPRTIDRDMEIFEREGVQIVWTPPVEEVYPEGFGTYIEPGPVSHRLEGQVRPGHFRGVATVVAKMFNVIRPNITAFGQKDWQQTRVVNALIQDLDFDIEMLVVPTVRSDSGLALSSRNERLSDDQSRAAAALYAGLKGAADAYLSGERDAQMLRDQIQTVLSAENLCQLEYVSVAHALTLDELDLATDPLVMSCAASVGSVHLIDNIVFGIDLYGVGEPA